LGIYTKPGKAKDEKIGGSIQKKFDFVRLKIAGALLESFLSFITTPPPYMTPPPHMTCRGGGQKPEGGGSYKGWLVCTGMCCFPAGIKHRIICAQLAQRTKERCTNVHWKRTAKEMPAEKGSTSRATSFLLLQLLPHTTPSLGILLIIDNPAENIRTGLSIFKRTTMTARCGLDGTH